ncbi:hypothetical protein Scep_023148 [Stephania cephalantha]|uniref:High-affinity potassium transporter n=1 Tax=Stephania cephalantha TaxID=152367 RepID=A0AAP0HSI6_9MAGN
MEPRTDHSFRAKDLDMFFMSVSATKLSSMSTVEMEVFSNAQLVIFTILMFLGGEIFVSMLGLQFEMSKLKRYEQKVEAVNSSSGTSSPSIPRTGIAEEYHIESGFATMTEVERRAVAFEIRLNLMSKDLIRYQSVKYLGYLAMVLVVGSAVVSMYIVVVSIAKEVLSNKGLEILTFSVFTTVSTFTNCGFIPTNENMIVFKNNSGLLLILIPQVLLGKTLYPSCLRLVIWVLQRFTKRKEFDYLLKNSSDIGCHHLLTGTHSVFFAATVFGFLVVQLVLFCSVEWNSGVLDGLSSYQKFMAALFQTVNSRHTGESVVDLSAISPAILVLFVVMMYLPPYTSFLPTREDEHSPGS